jgi:hypothetical protein
MARAFEQIRNILAKMDRAVDAARKARLDAGAPALAAVGTTQSAPAFVPVKAARPIQPTSPLPMVAAGVSRNPGQAHPVAQKISRDGHAK